MLEIYGMTRLKLECDAVGMDLKTTHKNEDDLDTITDSITSYICFCEENIVQTKRIKVYANSKPWVNRELKTNLLEKRKAFFGER